MWRKLSTVLMAVVAFGPALAVLYLLSNWRLQPAVRYPDLHTPWATLAIVCGWLGLAVALDLVLQVVRRDRRLSHGAWLFVGVAAACGACLYGLWTLWLTPLRAWALLIGGLGITGLFYLLYQCRRSFELRLFGVIFFLGGLVLFVVAIQEVRAIADMTHWAKTQGRIRHSGGSGSRASKFFVIELTYEYVVDGRQYAGSDGSWKSSRARQVWIGSDSPAYPSYGWREPVAVYYDPADPEKAVLTPGLSYATAFLLKTSLLGVLAGLTLSIVSTQARRTRDPAAEGNGAAAVAGKRTVDGHVTERWAVRIAFTLLPACALVVLVGIRPVPPGHMRVAPIDRVPTTTDELCRRGLDFLRGGDAKRAINNFVRALHLDPDDAALYYNRGHAFAELGRISEALHDWKKAIELDWHLALRLYYARRRLPSEGAELDQIITEAALNRLGDLDTVEGFAVGGMAEPGEFYTVSLILADHLDDTAFLRMAGDERPVLRAMALICLARRDPARHQTTIRSFYDDTAQVPYVPVGCMVSPISLAELARSIADDPDVLQYWAPEKTAWLWREQLE
jgi:tetratricopeptide (TPR) repeat protein